MGALVYKPKQWLATEGSDDAIAKVAAYLKLIATEEKVSLLKDAAEDKAGARTRLAGVLKQHGLAAAWEKSAKESSKPAKESSAKPASKKASAAKPASVRPAKQAAAKKATPKKAPPKEKPAAKKAAPKKAPKKAAPKEEAPSSAAALREQKRQLQEATEKLRRELKEHREACPAKRANMVRDAAAVLAAAKASNARSPEVLVARGVLSQALSNVAGYKDARKALADAEKSPAVVAAKENLAQVRTSARGAAAELLAAALRSPEVVAAEAALALAKKPEEVIRAVENLARARAMCSTGAEEIRRKYAPTIGQLEEEVARAAVPAPRKPMVPVTVASLLASVPPANAEEGGPLTALSVGSSRRLA